MLNKFKTVEQSFDRITESSYQLKSFRIGSLIRTFETTNGMFGRFQDADNKAVSVNISERDVETYGLEQGMVVNGEYNSKNGYFNVISVVTNSKSTPKKKVELPI